MKTARRIALGLLPLCGLLAASVGCGGSGGHTQVALPPVPTPLSLVTSGGPGNDYVETGVVFSNGTSATFGEYEPGATFGIGEPGEVTLDPAGSGGVFVARYASDGSLAWLRHVDVPPGSWVSGASAMGDGSVLVAAMFAGTVVFEAGTPIAVTLSSGGQNGVFLARYSETGTFQWAGLMRGANIFGGIPVSRADGGIFLVGTTKGPTTFGVGLPSETTKDAGANNQCYIANLASDGAVVGVNVLAATGGCFAGGVVTHTPGVWTLAVVFSGSVGLGSPNNSAATLVSEGGVDVALAHFTTNAGQLAWARRLGGTGDEGVDALTAMPDGGVALTSAYTGTMTFDGAAPHAQQISTSKPNALYLCRYDASGEPLWARTATSSDDTLRNPGLGSAPDGTLLLATTFWSAVATVDPAGPSPVPLQASGDSDGLLERWDALGNLTGLARLGVAGLQQVGTVLGASDGTWFVLGIQDGSVVYDPSGADQTTSNGIGQADLFVLRLAGP